MRKICVTGGAGFIGSHIVDRFARAYPGATIVVLDKMTSVADTRNLLDLILIGRIQLTVGDVCDLKTCERAIEGAELVIHAAAESHVDYSFGNSLQFTQTNVIGTHCILEACSKVGVPRLIHVSTDEVYGEVPDGYRLEESLLAPTNPYSASKAAAEMLILSYIRSYGLPVITVRVNNVYGIRQFPEKIIPRFILKLMMGENLPIHGTGRNVRHYLAVQDLVAALEILARHGESGQCYNIGSSEEYSNLQIASMLCELFDVDASTRLDFVDDRPFNDCRYAVNAEKMAVLNWQPHRNLASEIPSIVQWYLTNHERYIESATIVSRPSYSKPSSQGLIESN